MSDIFREVDEALQQEKLEKIWKEYGSTIILALIILVASTAITSAYYSWNHSRNAEETARLLEALDSTAPHQALSDVIKDTRGKHEGLGLMISANMYMDEGKTAEAAALYKQAADSSKTPKDMRDLARILYAQTATEDQLEILEPVLRNNDSPWNWHARIEAAVITAHQQNDYEKAKSYLSAFNESTKTIPMSLKRRGEALYHIYSLKQQEKAAAEKTEPQKLSQKEAQ